MVEFRWIIMSSFLMLVFKFPGDDATTTTSPTIKSPSATRNKWTSGKMNTSEDTNSTESTNNNSGTKQGWWWFIIIFVGLVALLINVVAVIGWKRSKGNKTQMDENMADPEDGVAYASISYTKKSNSKARVRGDDDDEGDAVTYSTVKFPSSSAGASADPSSFYATIN